MRFLDGGRDEWIDNRPPSGASKATSGGLAISLSACGDDQFAADTSVRHHLPHLLNMNFIFYILYLLNFTFFFFFFND